MVSTKKIIDRYYLVILIFLFLLGVGLRAYFLFQPITKLSFDEAVYAFQAFNILGGERSVFYYQQSYTGTLQAYLTAGLYYFLGVHEIWAKVVPLFFSYVYLLLIYVLSYQVSSNRYISLLSLLIASLSTSFWLNWSSRAGSGYNEMSTFGLIVLILAIYLVRPGAKKARHVLLSFSMGLAAGLGFWVQPTMVYFLLPTAFYVLFARPFFSRTNSLLMKSWYAAIPGLVLGMLPVIVCNVTGCATTASSLVNKVSVLEDTPWGAFWNVVSNGLPILLGVRKSFSTVDYVPELALLMYVIALGALALWLMRSLKADALARNRLFYIGTILYFLGGIVWAWWQPNVPSEHLNVPPLTTVEHLGIKLLFLLFMYVVLLFSLTRVLRNVVKGKIMAPADLIILVFFSVIVVFIFSPPFNRFVIEPRYLSPLYAVYPIMLAGFIVFLYQKHRSLGVLVSGILLIAVGTDYAFGPPDSFFKQRDITKLMAFLEQQKINYIWTETGMTYEVIFKSRGKIIARSHDNIVINGRIPEFSERILTAPDNEKAVVLYKDKRTSLDHCSRSWSNGKPCTETLVDEFYVYRW